MTYGLGKELLKDSYDMSAVTRLQYQDCRYRIEMARQLGKNRFGWHRSDKKKLCPCIFFSEKIADRIFHYFLKKKEPEKQTMRYFC
jgi:hypothetical protein